MTMSDYEKDSWDQERADMSKKILEEKEDESEGPALSELMAELMANDDGIVQSEFAPSIDKCFSCGCPTQFKMVLSNENEELSAVPVCTSCIVDIMRNEYVEYLRPYAASEDHMKELINLDMPMGSSICFYTTLGDIIINKVPNKSTSMSDYNLIFAAVSGSYYSRQFYTFRNQFETAFNTIKNLLDEICPNNTMPRPAVGIEEYLRQVGLYPGGKTDN